MTDNIICPYAKSDMTPCVIRDGEICVVDNNICVGCEKNIFDMLKDLVSKSVVITLPQEYGPEIQDLDTVEVRNQKQKARSLDDLTSKEVNRLEYRGWVIQTFYGADGVFHNLSGPGMIYAKHLDKTITWLARAKIERPVGVKGLFGHGLSEDEAIQDVKKKIVEKEAHGPL